MRLSRLTFGCLALLGAASYVPAALAQDHGHKMPSHDMMAMMDPDGDGRVSAAEHAAGAEAMFAKADANHDGYLSHEEMMAAHKPRGMEGHAMHGDKAQGDKKMACCCCGGEDGKQACGMGDKKDPVAEAMSGHAG